jgi:uncharacterized protein YdiU (UPF0061 family)
MTVLRFDNRYLRELPADPIEGSAVRQVEGAAYSRVSPTPVRAPCLLAHAREVAEMLGLAGEDLASPAWTAVLAGNALWPGMETYATCYGGHQFGQWAGQLGDGRAILLGESIAPSGARHEWQLKGAGLTPYSRHADGRAVLRSSLREFICSEAMHHLGVPTTRALSLVASGEAVVRDMFYDGRARPEPGAIVCRIAPSFIRFGHFELPSARGDIALLTRFIDFTIARDFSKLSELPENGRRVHWFHEVCRRTAELMAHWTRVGFVHGVMNTDNMSILGLTIDYGPYGWLDNFDPDWTPNTTDLPGRRYRFGQQPAVAYWNLVQLANAVYPVIEDESGLQAGLELYAQHFEETNRAMQVAKLGWQHFEPGDGERIGSLHALLQQAQADMTLFYRALAELNVDAPDWQTLQPVFYDEALFAQHREALQAWLVEYAARCRQEGLPAAERRARMNAVNPLYVPRNYLAQLAIDAAEQGDMSVLQRWHEVLRNPYVEQDGAEEFAAKRPDWARQRAGCSMLSCSS